jgi:hypothetical protein
MWPILAACSQLQLVHGKCLILQDSFRVEDVAILDRDLAILWLPVPLDITKSTSARTSTLGYITSSRHRQPLSNRIALMDKEGGQYSPTPWDETTGALWQGTTGALWQATCC